MTRSLSIPLDVREQSISGSNDAEREVRERIQFIHICMYVLTYMHMCMFKGWKLNFLLNASTPAVRGNLLCMYKGCTIA